jgi:dihydroorotate dehydrogenase electron transfer subunit
LNRYFRAKVLNNTPLKTTTYLLTLQPLEQVHKPFPGQFYMIEAGSSYDPLLKRPFSYLRRTPDGIQFLYTVRGKGTHLMSEFQAGRTVRIVGPLGNGYPNPRKTITPILIAGGTGIASIYSLAEEVSGKAYVLYGARCREDLIMLSEIKRLKQKNIVCVDCTDDGSCGLKGTVVDALEKLLITDLANVTAPMLYACGPEPMLRSVSQLALKKGLKGFVSLEENMACGFGACLGCAVSTVKGNKRVCKEGPVFPIGEIEWASR